MKMLQELSCKVFRDTRSKFVADMNIESRVRRTTIVIVAAIFLCINPQRLDAGDGGWYAGIDGGVQFGFSTLSSFGTGNSKVGYAFGAFVGYRFNRIFSSEFSAGWGEIAMTSRRCCVKSGYWLGAGGSTYLTPVAGMAGSCYDDLKGRVKMQDYAIQFNTNMITLFNSGYDGPWTADISPLVSLTGTSAKVSGGQDRAVIVNDGTKWHIGLGIKAGASCEVTRNIRIGVYSGAVYLTGNPIDGVSGLHHHADFVWESSVTVGWSFGKSPKKRTLESEDIHDKYSGGIIHPVLPKEDARAVETDVITQDDDGLDEFQESSVIEVMEAGKWVSSKLPIIYFSFNNITISGSEIAKLDEIALFLQENPDTYVRIEGWCDNIGTQRVNMRISRLRAETVKNKLVKRGIQEARMSIHGNGIDMIEQERGKARRVEVIVILKEE
ncbi:MAG: OmpA family protein [Lachnospiraceae bacterium]|nr:OmpA family protein [Lachnospiraceae bacterium]